ncbi:MAG: hypothetical protein CVU48_08555 [Candidatus Cloacimonetes bacterium HGW-Cloacimonetes-1]|jgi:hypothetical protein|nr:MAG: hypothetical protein CVU48_08555 [Candidatus Cloacimonetes bacterium HGW-Cloacimonetes-1]
MNENEIPEVNSEIEKVEVSKKKRRLSKSLIVSLFVVIGLSGILAGGFAFIRSSPQVRHISVNALAVAKIDLPRMLLKADMKKDMGQDNEELMSFLEDLNIESLVKDPKSTGLITAKPSYLFTEYDKKNEDIITYAVIPISNREKLASFFKKMTLPYNNDLQVKLKGDKYTIESNEFAVAWNSSSLIVGVATKLDIKDVQKLVNKYLDQTKSSSIASNKSFRKAHRKGHDVSLWLNLDAISNIAYTGFKDAKQSVATIREQRRSYGQAVNDYYTNYYNNYYYGVPFPQPPTAAQPANLFENILLESHYDDSYVDVALGQLKQLKDSSTLMYVDFNKGKIICGVKGETGSETRKKIKPIFSNAPGIDKLVEHIPKDGLIAATALNLNYDKLWTLSEAQIKKLIAKNTDTDMNELVKYAGKFLDGSVIISVNIPGQDKRAFYTAIASTKKNQGIESFVKKLTKDGVLQKQGKNYTSGDMTIFFEDGVIVLTSDYREYKKSEKGLASYELKIINSKPSGSYLDIKSLLDVSSKNMDRKVENALEAFSGITMQSKTSQGIPDELQVNVLLSDKKDNSLKVLFTTIADTGIFKGFKASDLGFKPKVEVPEYYEAVDTMAIY